MNKMIKSNFKEHKIVLAKTLKKLEKSIVSGAEIISNALLQKKLILWCGNGGSASDSMHLSAEFIGRFLINRKSIPAISLTTDTSILTAVGNDFGFENIFSRQCESLVSKGDIIIAISTSGNSSNVINGIKTAKEKGGIIISLTGNNGGKLNNISDKILKVPTEHIPHIQECHRVIIHILCDLIEKELMNDLN